MKIIQTIRLNSIHRLPGLKSIQKSWPHYVQINKRKDRDVRLENAAILCYSIGLAVVLLSWLLANELIFVIGSILLMAGLMCVLVLGFSNVRHAFNGYMSIFTIIGVLVVLVKLGFIDELLSAWKP